LVIRSDPLWQDLSVMLWPTARPSRATMDVVQASCRALADRPVRLSELFYEHLFDMAPWLRPMFAEDMTQQMQRMTDTLLAAIAELARTDAGNLKILLRQMGVDHYVRYQVAPPHYLYVAHALTRAVRDVSGSEFSSRLSSSWISVCKWVTEQMCEGARDAMQKEAEATGDPATHCTSTAPDPCPAQDNTRSRVGHNRKRGRKRFARG
jgi:hemoglobin-like flavoprotein